MFASFGNDVKPERESRLVGDNCKEGFQVEYCSLSSNLELEYNVTNKQTSLN